MPLYNPPIPTGTLMPYCGPDLNILPKSGWLGCSGSSVSRTTYSALFAVLNPNIATVTITIASPAVLTWTAIGSAAPNQMLSGDQVYLTTTGALPTGLTANTLYYVIQVSSSTFKLATSRANAAAGTAINTSGSQSGTHSLWYSPYGNGDGSTTFGLPDTRGYILAGNPNGASTLTHDTSNGVYGNQGAVGGEQSHALTTAEGPSHTHVLNKANAAGGDGSGYAWSSTTTSNSTGVATSGSNTAHNNVQPTLIVTYMIKT